MISNKETLPVRSKSNPKKVTTDAPQLRIANSQTYSDRGINDNIIFAPNWAAVQGTPTVHYATSLSSRNGY